MGLNTENLFAHGITLIRKTTNQLGRLGGDPVLPVRGRDSAAENRAG
jgi:hypothetical protein